MGPRPAWQPMSLDRSATLLWEPCVDCPVARIAVVSTIILLITAGGVEGCEVLPNRMRCFLGLRPGNRPITGDPLLLVHIRLDQARIDRKPFAANQPDRDAPRHHALEYPAQGIALTETLVPRTAEHGMVRDLVFDTELA